MAKDTDVFLTPADSKGRDAMRNTILEECPSVRYQIIGRSILGKNIECFFLGEGGRRVAFFGAHHALESITANLLYKFVYSMGGKEATFQRIGSNDASFLLRAFTYCVVPCVNPDGIEMRFHGAPDSPLKERQERMSGGDYCDWQANSRGVDLNHNYNASFFKYKQIEKERGITAGRSLYSGEYPESEPECRTVCNLIRTLMPKGIVSLHSQGEEIFFSPRERRVNRIAERLVRKTGYKLSVTEDTAAYGGLSDYTGLLGIPSFTIEVGKGKNPLSESEVPNIHSRIYRALAEFPTLL